MSINESLMIETERDTLDSFNTRFCIGVGEGWTTKVPVKLILGLSAASRKTLLIWPHTEEFKN